MKHNKTHSRFADLNTICFDLGGTLLVFKSPRAFTSDNFILRNFILTTIKRAVVSVNIFKLF